MDFSDKLALIIAALSIMALIYGLILTPDQPAAEGKNTTANSKTPETKEPPKADVWSLLSRENVELQCLKQARAYAEKQGVPSFAVASCKCAANETADVKSYNCTISAIDGNYPVDARCVKKEGRCLFTSPGGAIVYTFDEMEKLMAK